jgi:hypothetical protein
MPPPIPSHSFKYAHAFIRFSKDKIEIGFEDELLQSIIFYVYEPEIDLGDHHIYIDPECVDALKLGYYLFTKNKKSIIINTHGGKMFTYRYQHATPPQYKMESQFTFGNMKSLKLTADLFALNDCIETINISTAFHDCIQFESESAKIMFANEINPSQELFFKTEIKPDAFQYVINTLYEINPTESPTFTLTSDGFMEIQIQHPNTDYTVVGFIY